MSVEVHRAASGVGHIERVPGTPLVRAGAARLGSVWVLLLWQAVGVVVQVVAVTMSRADALGPAAIVSCAGFAIIFASALWVLISPRLTRRMRNAAVVCLGLTTTVQWRLTDPLMFRGYDEQLHLRTLGDIVSSHGLFQPNPLLRVGPYFPGLESAAAFFHQLGLPVVAAGTVVVLLARLVLVVVLCDAVEQLTGSPRAGGLAVAVYALSEQFVIFNAQFSYQTLALPLALAAVSFIARARRADHAGPLLIGAYVCLLAVGVTHHLIMFVTTVFLVVWSITERGRARRRVFCGALPAVLIITTAAVVAWPHLWSYFKFVLLEVIAQVTGGWRGGPFAERRVPFHDPGGFRTPPWERALMVYYAVVVTLVVLWLILIWLRAVLQRRRSAERRGPQRWRPRLLLVLLAAMLPLSMAAHVLPAWGEVGDRSSTFLFLALSLLVAEGTVRWSRSRRGRQWQSRPHRQIILARSVVVVLATGLFVGGLLMGGPDWARVPGGYLVGADNRSMDSETLAAVRWAREGLPQGSRIAADRVGAAALASQAGLWPVMRSEEPERLFVPGSLYFTEYLGPDQLDVARNLQLRYLYVDRRWASGLPHVGMYFYPGETKVPEQLTNEVLTKFDQVPGIRVVYRHRDTTIYDLAGIGVQEVRTGWVGHAQPLGVWIQLVIGVLAGLALAAVGRSRAGSAANRRARAFQVAAGPSLTFAAALAALCVGSVAMLSAHIWLGPTVFLSMALVVLLFNRDWVTNLVRKLRTSVARLHWKSITASAVVVLALAAAVAQSVRDAYAIDVTKVQKVLDDPAALHLPAQTAEAAHYAN